MVGVVVLCLLCFSLRASAEQTLPTPKKNTKNNQKTKKGFCKQQLWPLFHYLLPMSPASTARFDAELWQSYVKANKAFLEKIVEESATDADTVWIHDYHLLVLPSLLRKRFNKIRCGVFLHCPFPSSEIFRTFPKREELLRSMLNADLIGRAWGVVVCLFVLFVLCCTLCCAALCCALSPPLPNKPTTKKNPKLTPKPNTKPKTPPPPKKNQ